MNANDMKFARENTMGCWWPSKLNGTTAPNWREIANELALHAEHAERRTRECGTGEGAYMRELDRVATLAAMEAAR